jgi:hypothetical protein
MDNVSALISLDDIINKILLQFPENRRSINQKLRFTELAIDGLRQLRLLVTRDGSTTKKVIPDKNNRIPYPADCEEPIGIGIPYNGEIWYLTRNDSLIKTITVSGIDESLNEEQGEGVELPTVQFNTIYSKGGVNFAGYYTFDDVNREIIVNSNNRSDLLLVYQSSGINLSQETLVPYKYVSAIMSYVLWQDIVADITISENVKFAYEKRYKDRCFEIKEIEAMSFQEFNDAWSTGNSIIK